MKSLLLHLHLHLLVWISGLSTSTTLDQCLSKVLPIDRLVSKSNLESYQKAIFLFNSRLNSTLPNYITYPRQELEVSKIVLCARQFNCTVGIKSGGHSYEGYWQGTPGSIVIDLKYINGIKVDKMNLQVEVGGGSLLGPIIGKLWVEDKGALPHGLQPQIGIGGHTLGGGFGLLSRKYGLLVDQLIEMQVVLADGKIVQVTPTNKFNQLYLSLAGAGGGSYGVVTKFKFDYIKPPTQINLLKLNYQTDKQNFTKVVTKLLNYYQSDPTGDVNVFFNLNSVGKIFVGFTITADNQAIAKTSLDKIQMSLMEPDSKEFKTTDFIGAFNYFSGLGGAEADASVQDLIETEPELGQRYFKAKSGYLLNPLPTPIVEKLADLLTTNQRVGFFLLIDLHKAKIQKPKFNNSWVHRKALASVQIAAIAKDGLNLMEKVFQLLQPYFYQAYQNYIDIDQPYWLDKYYGDLKFKLVHTKNLYDPNDMFKFNQSIPLKL